MTKLDYAIQVIQSCKTKQQITHTVNWALNILPTKYYHLILSTAANQYHVVVSKKENTT